MILKVKESKRELEEMVVSSVSTYFEKDHPSLKEILKAMTYICIAEEVAKQIIFLRENQK